MIDLYYKYDPIKYRPTKSAITKGDGLVSRGMIQLFQAESADKSHMISVKRNMNRVLNGYACLYGLSARQMDQHIFKKHYQQTKQNIVRQINILKSLGSQLRTIYSYSSHAQLNNSPYKSVINFDPAKQKKRIAKALHRNRRSTLSTLCDGKQHIFTGIYHRSGISLTHMQPTMLIGNLRYRGKIVADHLWTVYDHALRKMGLLKTGYQIKILAKISPYRKNMKRYKHHQTCLDYGIAHVDDAMLLVPYYMSSPDPLPDDSISMAGEIMVRHKRLTTYRKTSIFYVQSYFDWLNRIKQQKVTQI